jgi:hypothetical protein
MLQLMIECSRTGRLIPTGIETDAVTYASLPRFEAKTFCPYCRRNHSWSKRDASIGRYSCTPAAPAYH